MTSGDRPDVRAIAGFEARCAWCGAVRLGQGELLVHVGAGAGLFEFRCPSCDRVNLRPLDDLDLQTLLAVGVSPASGIAPFELMEDRCGPPIGWDDLIDFHQALQAVPAWRDRTEDAA